MEWILFDFLFDFVGFFQVFSYVDHTIAMGFVVVGRWEAFYVSTFVYELKDVSYVSNDKKRGK